MTVQLLRHRYIVRTCARSGRYRAKPKEAAPPLLSRPPISKSRSLLSATDQVMQLGTRSLMYRNVVRAAFCPYAGPRYLRNLSQTSRRPDDFPKPTPSSSSSSSEGFAGPIEPSSEEELVGYEPYSGPVEPTAGKQASKAKPLTPGEQAYLEKLDAVEKQQAQLRYLELEDQERLHKSRDALADVRTVMTKIVDIVEEETTAGEPWTFAPKLPRYINADLRRLSEEKYTPALEKEKKTHETLDWHLRDLLLQEYCAPGESWRKDEAEEWKRKLEKELAGKKTAEEREGLLLQADFDAGQYLTDTQTAVNNLSQTLRDIQEIGSPAVRDAIRPYFEGKLRARDAGMPSSMAGANRPVGSGTAVRRLGDPAALAWGGSRYSAAEDSERGGEELDAVAATEDGDGQGDGRGGKLEEQKEDENEENDTTRSSASPQAFRRREARKRKAARKRVWAAEQPADEDPRDSEDATPEATPEKTQEAGKDAKKEGSSLQARMKRVLSGHRDEET